MAGIQPVNSSCPYCGEPLELLIDTSVRKQKYIEDCQVCCRPITVRVVIDEEGIPMVELTREDEA